MMHDCVLCPVLRFRFNEMADLPSLVLAQDSDFYVTPDVAPLVEGHLLLVSQMHWLCGGQLPERLWNAACSWRERVADWYVQAYGSGDVLVMEHGPATSQGGGACIDHFHWHLLPDRGELAAQVHRAAETAGLTGMPLSRPVLVGLYEAGRSYITVGGRVYPADVLPGQFLRGAVLEGEPVWRWQELLGLPESRSRFLTTLDALGADVEEGFSAAS